MANASTSYPPQGINILSALEVLVTSGCSKEKASRTGSFMGYVEQHRTYCHLWNLLYPPPPKKKVSGMARWDVSLCTTASIDLYVKKYLLRQGGADMNDVQGKMHGIMM
jgi:hypothetical protein